MFINIHGIRGKNHETLQLAIDQNSDIIILSETKLNQKLDSERQDMPCTETTDRNRKELLPF